MTASILCIDDEPAVGVILEHTLTRAGHRPTLKSSVEEAMRVIARTPVDLIIADYRMPGLTGLDLLAQLEREGYKIPVIIMTGYSSIEHAVMSIKSGAIDYRRGRLTIRSVAKLREQSCECYGVVQDSDLK